MITYGGQEIQKSPFDVNVGPKKQSSIVAFGPGLTGGMVGHPASFVVETNGETGALGFSVAGPSQAEIECIDNGDGSALVKYHPTAPGEYAVHILCDEEDIPKSPFIAQIIPKNGFNPENVKVHGKGIDPNGVSLGEKAEFTIDTKNAGSAPLDVKIYDSLGKDVPVFVNHKSEHLKTVSYQANSAKPHSVEGESKTFCEDERILISSFQ